ncbi:PstS family phosphate ABC transporter substrate-binding protein [Pseudanabaena sp. FACHB-2040]|uniref:PstS family phosphate ABC transporter substrate-binding protein n=1 Tax=Pseudanabaena sp. FACHB-2040 TaxID=2692859 RepID=UPI001686B3AE|nr:PstS family phosphate ABC transporter substrate-binding protein [Pseudanabaena sp. FACHB-2040]MBD2257113.1 PstS family phosphate ABC transporter substrate-binding protein [Pseudanabaena sp. FACHB-2040]
MVLTTLLSRSAYSVALAALVAGLAACGGDSPTATTEGTDAGGTDSPSGIAGDIQVDGSSTVFPISEAMAEEFMAANPETRVTVGVSGTGGGFEKFCTGETDISNASRPIKQEEIEACEQAGVEFVELPVAFDGITVVTNTGNDWVQCLTTEELNTIWAPEAEGQVANWNQVRPDFPNQPLGLYGPGTDSGTFDYFTDAINGEEGASRGDYTASEDDNVVVQGVGSDDGGLGYFGYAYYEENEGQLKALEIENEAGECVAPSRETIADGTYAPLARPIFIYVNREAYETKPQVQAFVDYQVDPANEELVSEAGYIALPADISEKVVARVSNATTGSIYEGGSSVGVKLSDKL